MMAMRKADDDWPVPDLAAQPSAPKRLDELAMALCEGVIDITAALFTVSSKELRGGSAAMGVARVRQIAMYVAHTVLGVSMKEVGRAFGRHRSTVAHACKVVEDLRDDKEFERLLGVAENVVRAAFRTRGGF